MDSVTASKFNNPILSVKPTSTNCIVLNTGIQISEKMYFSNSYEKSRIVNIKLQNHCNWKTFKKNE